MSLRSAGNLLAVIIGGRTEVLVNRASSVAQNLRARLTLLSAAAMPDAADYSPYLAAEAVAAISDEIAANAARALADIHPIVASQNIATRELTAGLEPLVGAVVHAARHADLVLFPDDSACGNIRLRDRLMLAVVEAASCPILVVRDREPKFPARRVILAWNGSRICSKAWRDAARLIDSRAHVDLVIGTVAAASRIGGVELAETARLHVEAQGYDVEVRRVPIHPSGDEWRPPHARLLEFERAADADLLIMGAGISNEPLSSHFSELTTAMIRSGRTNLLLAR